MARTEPGPTWYTGYTWPSAWPIWPTGYTWYTWATWPTWYTGYTWPGNFTGYTWPNGAAGATGYTGYTWATWYTWYTGAGNFTGYTGYTWYTWYTGATGFTGYTWPGNFTWYTWYTWPNSGFTGYTWYTWPAWSWWGMNWNEETTTSATMVVDNWYIANNASLVTLTIPTTAAVGKVVRVTGKGAWGWKIAQNASEIIHFGGLDTTTGTGWYLASTLRRDSVELVCVVADTEWNVISSIGNITII